MSESPNEAVIARIRAVYGRWRRDTPVSQMRADWEALFDAPVEAEIERAEVGGVRCEWVRPAGARRDRVVVYLHGGGFRVGSPRSHRELVARLATEAGAQALAVDYRLAPEHLLPAALEDALAVLNGLESSAFPADAIAISGDSAGAGLALGAMMERARDGRARLAGAYLMSAWTDLTASGESYLTRAELDPIHQRPMIQALARAALAPDASAEDPRLSPLFANSSSLAALPPLLLQVGGHETLVSDSEQFAARARTAGVEALLEVWPEMIHVFQQFPRELWQAREAVAVGGRFLARRLDINQQGNAGP